MKPRIAIIPARSGSKGLPDKNIRLLYGKPLLAYSVEAAFKSGLFECIHVSTDSDEYAEIGKKYGADIPFLRSEKNASDTAGSWDVVKEVLMRYRAYGKEFSSVCLLQPTSPLRSEEDIKNSYELMEQKQADAITSVCEVEHSPLWTMTLDDTLSMTQYRQRILEVPRQELDLYYRINGAIYIRGINYLKNEVELRYGKEFAYIMARARSVDIDTVDDFNYAEYLISINTTSS